jgi:hypothetical protein
LSAARARAYDSIRKVGADAVLYLGTALTNEYQENWSGLDPAYRKELTRRYKIAYGCEVDVTRLKVGQRPCS